MFFGISEELGLAELLSLNPLVRLEFLAGILSDQEPVYSDEPYYEDNGDLSVNYFWRVFPDGTRVKIPMDPGRQPEEANPPPGGFHQTLGEIAKRKWNDFVKSVGLPLAIVVTVVVGIGAYQAFRRR